MSATETIDSWVCIDIVNNQEGSLAADAQLFSWNVNCEHIATPKNFVFHHF